MSTTIRPSGIVPSSFWGLCHDARSLLQTRYRHVVKRARRKLKAFFRRSMPASPSKTESGVTTLPLKRKAPDGGGRSVRSGPAAYARAARRYNINGPVFVGKDGIVYKRDAPSTVYQTIRHHGHAHSKPLPAGHTGSPSADVGSPASEVPAQDVQNDLEYVVPVTVGTPGVTLNLDFDTGSSDLWVWSSELRRRHTGHTIYNPAQSSTSKPVTGATWNISYGDGSSASGNVFTDTVKIGTMTIPNQAIELAEKLSSAFLQESGSDGLLGLAFPQINTVQPSPVLTPVANIIQQVIAPGIFSVALDKGDGNGFYTFGGIDAVRAGVNESNIVYTPVDSSQGFWSVASESTTVNGQEVSQPGNTAILDTGTTLAMVSDAVASAVYQAIPGARLDQAQGGWIFPSDAQIPSVSIAIGNTLYTLNKEDLAFSDAGQGMTFGGVQSRGNLTFDILGDVFLKSVYVVFDQTNVQVGLAQRMGNVVA